MKKLFCVACVLVLCLSLAGCNSSQYKDATSLYEAGEYEDAMALFQELGDYEDSAKMVKHCKYDRATELFDDENYEDARTIFDELDTYQDSDDMVKLCDYNIATLLLEDDSYAEAKAIFEELDDYKDSADLCLECDYRSAEASFAAEDYETAISIYSTIPDYLDSANKLILAEKGLMFQQYGDVIQLMTAGVWFYNGGSNDTLNRITFTEDVAIVTQYLSDGNGVHESWTEEGTYTLDEGSIALTFADGTTQEISYTVADAALTLEGGYLTPAEVEADLQGYWNVRTSSTVLGIFTSSEYIFFFDDGSLTYEDASLALNGAPGEYYYYGPYTGTYVVDENGLTADIRNSWQVGFNVIDSKAVMVRCGDVCTPISGFKGLNGYSF